MNFFKMRAFNTFLFLVIGVLIGLLAKASPRRYQKTAGLAPKVADYQRLEPQPGFSDREAAVISEEKPGSGEEPAGEDMEIYTLPFAEEEAGNELPSGGGKPRVSGTSSGEIDRQSRAESFFQDPERYINSELELKLQLLNVEKRTGKWWFNMGYTPPNKGVTTYLALAADEYPDASSNLRVGYFYRVRFRSQKGELNSGNSLLSISPAEETPSITEEEP